MCGNPSQSAITCQGSIGHVLTHPKHISNTLDYVYVYIYILLYVLSG